MEIANNKNIYQVTSSDYPLSCPGKNMSKSESHPKIFIKLDKKGEGVCPYCGAIYRAHHNT
ncbi:MAG: zinc-finger domain-containing protein [Gammaproteobacteria bacterium]|nr:MAG: zinc-finger domain-containing protein [Gammaproteobacteria bacterium]